MTIDIKETFDFIIVSGSQRIFFIILVKLFFRVRLIWTQLYIKKGQTVKIEYTDILRF